MIAHASDGLKLRQRERAIVDEYLTRWGRLSRDRLVVGADDPRQITRPDAAHERSILRSRNIILSPAVTAKVSAENLAISQPRIRNHQGRVDSGP